MKQTQELMTKHYKVVLAIVITLLMCSMFMLGRFTAPQPKHYITNADEIELTFSYNYERLTRERCVTAFECETADIISAYNKGDLVRLENSSCNLLDVIPVFEPLTCAKGDKECQKQNRNLNRIASYPSVCEPYIE